MYNYQVHQTVDKILRKQQINTSGNNNAFYVRMVSNTPALYQLYQQLYWHHPSAEKNFETLLKIIITSYKQRNEGLRQADETKLQQGYWYLSNKLAGMSLYVDRFAGKLKNMPEKLDYLQHLGINLLHLMPLFESPVNESDGGYAVSNFRKVDKRFGSLEDLQALRQHMHTRGMYLMLDIVLNHTSHHHPWALKAKAGDTTYQDYYYMYPDRQVPDQFEMGMPEIFPESAPGNFTYIPQIDKWVMTAFHNYQWDLNFTNPSVFNAMLENILFYANLGVDVLRIDAPAFIWKKPGTTCQNLPEAHTLLRMIKLCVQIVAPGMALLGEAIVAPDEIIKYFGTGHFTARECDFAYNATHMALQWDMLATGDTRIMLAAQHPLMQKPFGTSWITYTRCHDDIGLGYNDETIAQAGYNPYEHRRFMKDFYSGTYPGSTAKGALFAVNPKTQDARISGTLASLCGLEDALNKQDVQAIDVAIQRMLLMQAHSFFMGGMPMLFYGDEAAYTNDYSYLQDDGKSYDNRWMHRPQINWQKNALTTNPHTPEGKVFAGTRQLLHLRSLLAVVADYSNLTWFTPHNIHVAGYVRAWEKEQLFCVFNFSSQPAWLTWYAFKEKGLLAPKLYNHWNQQTYTVGSDREYLILQPYEFMLLQPVE